MTRPYWNCRWWVGGCALGVCECAQADASRCQAVSPTGIDCMHLTGHSGPHAGQATPISPMITWEASASE